MIRHLSLVAQVLAMSVAATTDSLTNGLLQDNHILPLRRQVSNSSRTIYEVVETYDASNFWDKFQFIETTPDNGDPTHGFVVYQNRSEAERLGLISIESGVAQMKVDHTTAIRDADLSNTNVGRKSVRVESIASYKEGLIVADFDYLPRTQCGSWPAFWMYAKSLGWPNGGEIDVYEQWNAYPFNRQSIHMNATFTGACSLAISHDALAPVMTNYNYTQDCNVTQPANIGCSTWDYEGPYGSATGGTYALLLSPATNSLKLWAWHQAASPFSSAANGSASASTAAVDPSTWGTPGLVIGDGDSCDVARTFANQTIVLNLEVCGDAVSSEDWVGDSGCAVATGYNSCARFAAAEPAAFEGVGFGVRSLRVYQARQ